MANASQKNDLIALTEDAFLAALSSFKQSAFRFEVLQSYDVEDERESYNAFLAGDSSKAHPSKLPEWCSQISSARKQGKLFQRVRLVNFPIDQYVQWEILYGYPSLSKAGEDIRILETTSSKGTVRTPYPFQDFWLFDDACCILLEYDSLGSYLRPWRVPDPATSLYVSAKSMLLGQGVPFRQSKAWEVLSKQTKVKV